MWRLAQQVARLDHVISEASEPGEMQRQEAMRILSEMEKVAGHIGGEGWETNHPEVSRNIDKFIHELVAARHALEVEPPSFYLAGTISVACVRCRETK